MPHVFRPPRQLAAWELDLDGERFILFEWPLARVAVEESLTEAERAVLDGIVRGESNAAIARHRRRSVRTIAKQVASIFRKLGVRSRLELIALASRGGGRAR